jgi:DNA-binding LacI/PurR family transcriptional regulator
MARGTTERITDVKATLTERIASGVYRPGERFLSARTLAGEFGVSYQTAHRLLTGLTDEGYLTRRAASGTFVAGEKTKADASLPYPALMEARLVFSPRAKQAGSFGARLLSGLGAGLRQTGIAWQVVFADSLVEPLPPYIYPVLWEAEAILAQCLADGRPALILNARPAPGLSATRLDSVSADDFFGGACAADLLQESVEPTVHSPRFAIVCGPETDSRSNARRDGFLSRIPSATIIHACGWYASHGQDVAHHAVLHGEDGLFCANDRLAEGVLTQCGRLGLPRPRLVGFDDAPIAAKLALSTIAIPWEELIADATDTVARRLRGDKSAARRRIVTPRPVVRTL